MKTPWLLLLWVPAIAVPIVSLLCRDAIKYNDAQGDVDRRAAALDYVAGIMALDSAA
jgi:hypothetical protein